jgi:integrase
VKKPPSWKRAADGSAGAGLWHRTRAAGLPASTCCYTFRATGITAYLENGGTIENAQAIAAHESTCTTKLYDRTSDEITLDEVETVAI